MVAMAATICVVITTCSNDEERSKPDEINNDGITNRFWWNCWTDDFSIDLRYGIRFNSDGTYSYITPTESFAGNYMIFESLKSAGVVNYSWQTHSDLEMEIDYTLFKMNVTGSSDFDQLWVYLEETGHVINKGAIFVHFYSNNVLVRKPTFGRYIYW